MVDACPPIERWREFVAGQLDSPSLESLRLHLCRCPACQHSLDELTQPVGLAIAFSKLRSHDSLVETAPGFQAAVHRLKAMSTSPVRGETPFDIDIRWTESLLGPPTRPGDLGTMDGYFIEAQIGLGGMGIVFRAFDPTLARRVAIKVLRPERIGEANRQRLLREAKAAAKARHDHLVTVHAVVDPAGKSPYLVMEFLSGLTLTEETRAAKARDKRAVGIAPRQACEWVEQIARGLAEAHRRGVIHRDVKPDNIVIDALSGRAKLMDFGLARTDWDEQLTRHDQVAGTPAYMSPEQACGSDDLDARCDVYGAGATLYETLAGEPPFRGTAHAILEQIRLDEPRSPRQLNHEVDSDLETIVLTAMAKERDRRYRSADELAADLRRWLACEPIAARPIGPLHRLLRWRRRNPRVATLSIAVVGLLVAITAVSSFAAFAIATAKRQIEEQRDTAVASNQRAIDSAKAANENAAIAMANEARARTSEANATAMLLFLQEKILAAGRPVGEPLGLGKDVSLRKALDGAEAEIAGSFKERPTLEAAIRFTVGQSYYALGEPQRALGQHRRALALYRSALGPAHPDTVNAMSAVVADLHCSGSVDEAIQLGKEAVAIAEKHFGENELARGSALNGLGAAYLAARRPDLAIEPLEKLAALQRSRLAFDDPKILLAGGNLASAYFMVGRRSEARKLAEHLLAIAERKLGGEQLTTLNLIALLGNCLLASDPSRAAELFERVARARKAQWGPEHSETLAAESNLATAYVSAKKLELATAIFERTLAAHRKLYGKDHQTTLAIELNLGSTYLRQGRLHLALPLLRQSRDNHRKKYGNNKLPFANSLAGIGKELLRAGQAAEAEAWFAECVAIRKGMSSDDWSLPYAQWLLGEALVAQGKWKEAEPLLLKAHAQLSRRKSNIPPRFRHAMDDAARLLAAGYEKVGNPALAESWRKQIRSNSPGDAIAKP